MLKTRLLHPEILKALGSAGHFSQVLIADANFPVATRSHPNATKVFLILTAGIPRTTEVLDVLLDSIPVQDAAVMQVPNGAKAPVHAEFQSMLPNGVELKYMERIPFYEAAASSMTALVIATGETRRFANILLTIGALKLNDDENY
jgi:L-fucose mutarotase